MSNDQNGLSGIDNLTPFEYALAGVRPTNSQESPSLAVVEQMRALAEEVQDAPISQPRLQELMRGGGSGKRSDRRGFKRRRSAADGGFVDITPVELAEQNLGSADAANSETKEDEFESVAMMDSAPAIFDETEPTSEQPAIGITGHEPTEDLTPENAVVDDELNTDEKDDSSPFGPGLLALGGATNGAGIGRTDANGSGDDLIDLTGGGDHDSDVSALDGPPIEASETPALAEADFDREFDAIQAAMMEAETADEATFYDIPIDLDPDNPDQSYDGLSLEAPPPEPDDEHLFFPSENEHREASGRFAGDYLFADEASDFASEEPLTPSHTDDGTAVLVPSVGGEDSLILDSEPDHERNPAAVAALTGAVPVPERRFGGAFWALAGTAAAAAVLALGGLLWANSLNDGTQTESASATAEAETADGSETDASAGEGSTSDGTTDDGSTTAALDSDLEADERPALAVDGEDTGSTTTLDPDSSSATTEDPPAGDDPTTDGTTPTDDPSATTEPADVTQTTEAPATTEPETTEPPASEVTTTQPPTTPVPTTAAPTTQPPTTPAPVLRPSFIGDRVSVGSFEGPGLGNVRVRLFVDSDRNGTADELVSNDVTDDSGYYGFDEYPEGCYVVEFSRIPSGLTLDTAQASQSFCLDQGDQNGRFDAVAEVAPPDNCIVEVSNNFRDRGVEVHENDFDRAESYTFYNQNGGVVFRTSQVGAPDDLDPDNPYGDYEWFAEESGFNHRNVHSVATERFGVESTPLTCERQ